MSFTGRRAVLVLSEVSSVTMRRQVCTRVGDEQRAGVDCDNNKMLMSTGNNS